MVARGVRNGAGCVDDARVLRASAAGIILLERGGLMETMRIRVFIVPLPADLLSNSTFTILRFRQALRQAIAVSFSASRMDNRLARSRRVSRWASGIAGESEAQSGQALQSHVSTAAGAHAAAFPACNEQAGHRRSAKKLVTGWQWSSSVGRMLARHWSHWAMAPDSSNNDASWVSLSRFFC